MATGGTNSQYRLSEDSQGQIQNFLDPQKNKGMWIRVKLQGNARIVTLLPPMKFGNILLRLKDILFHLDEYFWGLFSSRNIEAKQWLLKSHMVTSSSQQLPSQKAIGTTAENVLGKKDKSDTSFDLEESSKIVRTVEASAVSCNQRKIIIEELLKRNIPEDRALKIAEGALNGWKDFYKEVKVGQEQLCRQTHDVKGLKVYRDPRTKEIVADIAFKDLGSGGFKRAKGVARILSTNEILDIVRYAIKNEDPNYAPEGIKLKLAPQFVADIATELKSRHQAEAYEKRGKVPHLLGLYEALYINAKGVKKTRYLTERCDGDLGKFFADEEEMSLERKKTFFKYSQGALEALVELHEGGFVHNDIKPQNIFFHEKREEGVLADLGLMAKTAEEVKEVYGSEAWLSPEKLFDEYKIQDPKSDVFSFGLMLLRGCNWKLYDRMRDAYLYLAH